MAGKKHTVSRKPSERGTFHVVNFIIMCIIMLITVYPIWFAVINSLNYGDELVKGYSFLLPARIFQALSERKEILYGAWVYQYVFQRRNYSILRAV